MCIGIGRSYYREILWGFVLIIIFSGCGVTKGYDGPELPKEKVSSIRFDTDSRMYELTLAATKIDGRILEYPEGAITVLPGHHSVSFKWSFQTADDEDSEFGIDFSWEKRGACQVDFVTQANEKYYVRAHTDSGGTYFSDPEVSVKVLKICKDFWCAPQQIAEGVCYYGGREGNLYLNLKEN